MISTDSLNIKWITKVAKANRNADKILVEKVIRALYLLELLQRSGLNFIFKGGTALFLMMKEARRLSIDIDIIVPGNKDITKLLEWVIDESDFLAFEENERSVNSGINKAHYKFFYKPVTNTRAEREYILLDVLYERSPYGKYTVDHSIQSPFLITNEKYEKVIVPSFEAILGDKLTAYAPNTTGVPYGKGKEIEIIKQLYDVGNLFDHITEIESVSTVFETISTAELGYRALKLKVADVLDDIWETSLLITTRGKEGKGDFPELQRGIRNIRNFIFSERFHLDSAMVTAAKAAYLASLVQAGERKIERQLIKNEKGFNFANLSISVTIFGRFNLIVLDPIFPHSSVAYITIFDPFTGT